VSPVLAAAAAMAVGGGILLLLVGLRRVPERPARPSVSLWRTIRARRHDTRTLVAVGLLAGLVLFALTGWAIAFLIGPIAAVGIPFLLAPKKSTGVDRLDAMAEWTRSLSGVLTVGTGLEQAIIATNRSVPSAIQDEVNTLTSRLRARWEVEAALRAFADDLDDATGDLIAAALILGARRRGSGLGAILDGLAASVTAEVRVRRQIEADRAKPRATARWVTLITFAVLGLLVLNGEYLEPYATPVGQVILALLLTLYAAALLWLRRVAIGKPLPRFLGARVAEEAAR
jgi:Flp pilus assembly protein TadB